MKDKLIKLTYILSLENLMDSYRTYRYKILPLPVNIINTSERVSYAGWWSCNDYENEWLLRFIKLKVKNYANFDIRFYSVFNDDAKAIKANCKKFHGKKFFYFGENLTPYVEHGQTKVNDYYFKKRIDWMIKSYSDYLIPDVDLSLGFADISNNKYLRFPLWIFQGNFFPVESTYNDIKNIIHSVNSAKSICAQKCICINSHDGFGLRSKIADDLKNILDITYAGRWRNNTSELWNKYNNDKLKYMNLFQFNICSENMDAPHYCTEKIFDSFRAGCIPIYTGALNNPEPNVINKDSVIFWNLDGDNTENIKLIKRLKSDESFYNKFMQQNKFLPSAAEYIYDRFTKLENKLKETLL
jgi:hypothetical protein